MYNKKQKLGRLDCVVVSSFCSALEFLKSNQREEGLIVNGPIELSRKEKEALRTIELSRKEKEALKTIPTYFASMEGVQLLKFEYIEITSKLLSEAVAAGVRNDTVVFLSFARCRVRNPALMKSITQAMLERLTPFELHLYETSKEYTKKLLEASYLKCSSLEVHFSEFSGLDKPMKKLFSRARLCSLSLIGLEGLKESTFLLLARDISFFPELKKLVLGSTYVPISALKRLYSSLNLIVKANPSNTLEALDLGDTEMDEPLAYCYATLLRSEHLKSLDFFTEGDTLPDVVTKTIWPSLKTKNKIERRVRINIFEEVEAPFEYE